MGGLFFDDLNCWDFETCFKYIQAVGNGYLNAILPIFEKHREQPYTEAQREFQLYRRGRYVEYNLVYDRGTLFGLQTGGRIESILVSLPNLAAWSYRPEWDEDSPEKRLTDYYLKPRDWLGLEEKSPNFCFGDSLASTLKNLLFDFHLPSFKYFSCAILTYSEAC